MGAAADFIVDAETVGPIVRLFSEFGPFALCIILLFSAYLVLRTPNGNIFAGVLFVASLVSGALGVYIFMYPPDRYYVHEMRVLFSSAINADALPEKLSLFSRDDRVWMKAPAPAVQTVAGLNHYEWKAIALDRKAFDDQPAFMFRIGWVDRSGSQPFDRFDDLTAEFPSDLPARCHLERHDDAAEIDTPDSPAPFRLRCESREAPASEARRDSGFSLVRRAMAQSTLPVEQLEKMSREELIELLKQAVPQSPGQGEPLLLPAENRPVVIYYTKESDDGRVLEALSETSADVVEKPSNLPHETNAMWVGRDVDPRIAEAIATSLIEAGVGLQYFGRFSDPNTKTNLIEVGTSVANSSRPVLSKEAIEATLPEPDQ